MRLRFEFILVKKQLPLDYRKIFISLFKTALEKSNESIKEKYYHEKDPIKKPFTFSVYLNNPKFYRDYIVVESNKVILNFSTACYETGVDYYNGLLKMINYAYPLQNENYLILKNIVLVKEKRIIQNEILIKTMSPILVRKHDRDKNFDIYLTPRNENFIEEIKKNLILTVTKFGLDELKREVENFQFIDIGKGEEVKVFFYGHKISGLIGRYLIKGNPTLLDFIVKTGIGSRTSSGFGMLEVEGVSG